MTVTFVIAMHGRRLGDVRTRTHCGEDGGDGDARYDWHRLGGGSPSMPASAPFVRRSGTIPMARGSSCSSPRTRAAFPRPGRAPRSRPSSASASRGASSSTRPGPRPERPALHARRRASSPARRRGRNGVPGCTGWQSGTRLPVDLSTGTPHSLRAFMIRTLAPTRTTRARCRNGRRTTSPRRVSERARSKSKTIPRTGSSPFRYSREDSPDSGPSVPSADYRPRASSYDAGTCDALRAEHFTRPFLPHFHDTFAIRVVQSGETGLRTHRGEWVASAGTILEFSSGEVQGVEAVGRRSGATANRPTNTTQLAPTF